MKAYKLEVLVIDFDGLGGDGVVSALQDARFPNRCISPKVMATAVADLGEWSDDHPLNKRSTASEEYKRLFGA